MRYFKSTDPAKAEALWSVDEEGAVRFVMRSDITLTELHLVEFFTEVDADGAPLTLKEDDKDQFQLFDELRAAWDDKHQLCFSYSGGRWRVRQRYTIEQLGTGMTCDAARRVFARVRGVPLWDEEPVKIGGFTVIPAPKQRTEVRGPSEEG